MTHLRAFVPSMKRPSTVKFRKSPVWKCGNPLLGFPHFHTAGLSSPTATSSLGRAIWRSPSACYSRFYPRFAVAAQ